VMKAGTVSPPASGSSANRAGTVGPSASGSSRREYLDRLREERLKTDR